MKRSMMSFFAYGAIAIGMAIFATPFAHAVNYNVQDLIGAYENKSSVCDDGSKVGHLVPCARHCDNPDTPTQDETEPCSVCHLIVLGHNIVEYIVFIAVFVAFAFIVFAGVMYVVSVGDQGMITTAKAALRSALFGTIFVLIAWAVINTLITVFLKPNTGTFQGDWRQYYCVSDDVQIGGGSAGSDIGSDTNPDTGGSDTNPDTGGSDTNPDTGDGAKTGAESKVDPAQYAGTVYCNIATTANKGYYTMDYNECYSDQDYCNNKFTNCTTFNPGSEKTRKYPLFRVYDRSTMAPVTDIKIMASGTDGNLVPTTLPDLLNQPFTASDDLDPARYCEDILEATKASLRIVALQEYLPTIENMECFGAMK